MPAGPGSPTRPQPRWRVAVTRDEDADGPLGRALRLEDFEPASCPVSEAQPPSDPAALARAAAELDRYDWAVFASQRAVVAIVAARGGAWPRGLRTAAVGARTADALIAAGADPPPVAAVDPGADALWEHMKDLDGWSGKRVLIPAVKDGRRALIDGLTAAGADVTVVEAYRMQPRDAHAIAEDWRAIGPEAVVVASPSAARLLVDAIGRDAVGSLRAVIAIGETTAAALAALGIRASTPPRADFSSAARLLADLRARAAAAQDR